MKETFQICQENMKKYPGEANVKNSLYLAVEQVRTVRMSLQWNILRQRNVEDHRLSPSFTMTLRSTFYKFEEKMKFQRLLISHRLGLLTPDSLKTESQE